VLAVGAGFEDGAGSVSSAAVLPSLAYGLRMWVRTVLRETYGSLAICGADRLDRPGRAAPESSADASSRHVQARPVIGE
jgi:hypothetical protein